MTNIPVGSFMLLLFTCANYLMYNLHVPDLFLKQWKKVFYDVVIIFIQYWQSNFHLKTLALQINVFWITYIYNYRILPDCFLIKIFLFLYSSCFLNHPWRVLTRKNKVRVLKPSGLYMSIWFPWICHWTSISNIICTYRSSAKGSHHDGAKYR